MAASPRRIQSHRARIVAAAASVLVALFCVYRVLTFNLQPFDSPGTLRPFLYACFRRFVQRYSSPEQAQHAWRTYCIAALFVLPILVFWNYLYNRHRLQRAAWLHKLITSRWLLFVAIAACLGICRFPFLLAGELNPDETYFIAAAEKLFKDPVFFRAVDFATSGPLNVYPLMTPAVFGFSPDYATTRLVALAIILASIYTIYRTLALLTDDAAARIAVLPAAGAFAVLKLGDYVVYTSEHVSFLLLAVAFYLCVRTLRRPDSSAWNLAGLGALTSAAFFAKMQAVPLLLAVAAVTVAYLYRSGHAGRWWRPAILLTAGAAPLPLANAIVCVLAGAWHDFRMEYIVANSKYAGAQGTVGWEIQRFVAFTVGITEIRLMVSVLLAVIAASIYWMLRRKAAPDWAMFLRMAALAGLIAVAANKFLLSMRGAVLTAAAIVSMLILPGLSALLWRTPGSRPNPARWFGFTAAAVLAAAVGATFVPLRLFPHYLLLLVLPIAIMTAWPVMSVCADAVRPVTASRLPFLLVFAGVTLTGQIFELGSPDAITFASVTPTVGAADSKLIDALVPPQGRIAVWGWDARPYVGSGRVCALKDLFSGQLFLTGGEVRSYYRRGYLAGLQRHRPELFIDATGTSYIREFRNPKVHGLEAIPEIESFIRSNYRHVLDGFGQSFYLRRDLPDPISQRYPLPPGSLTLLWRAGDPLPRPSSARLQVTRRWIEVTPTTDDPQLLFDLGPELGRFQTLIVRAWFEKADRIDAFFARQVDGRGVNGVVPVTQHWLDVYLNLSQNPFWKGEHGTTFRFDPVSSAGPGTNARIAEIWGSAEAAPPFLPDVQFYPVPSAEAPSEP